MLEAWAPAFLAPALATPLAAPWAGLLIGLCFGVLAQRSAFCLRRAVIAQGGERRAAAAIWLVALTLAVSGTQLALSGGWLDLAEHRFLNDRVAVPAIILGGVMFGIGMVLCRGCISRLAVLSTSGNLRALTSLLIVAVVAQMSIQGVLAPVREWFGAIRFDMAAPALGQNGALMTATVLIIATVLMSRSSPVRPLHLVYGGLIGLLVPLTWMATALWLSDPFDPLPVESLSFTQPLGHSMFYLLTATAIAPNLQVGLVGGTLIGALLMHLRAGSLRWQGFESAAQTGRYLLGAAMMGFGGVLAGGCTIGAGLSGVSTLSFAAILALACIIAGGVSANAWLERRKPHRIEGPSEALAQLTSESQGGIVGVQGESCRSGAG